jgi:predicted nuclease of predicted toxin-antitoxin system
MLAKTVSRLFQPMLTFYQLAITVGPPPKVIWLKGCDYPTAIVEEVMRREAIRIAEFEKDPEQVVLVLQPR